MVLSVSAHVAFALSKAVIMLTLCKCLSALSVTPMQPCLLLVANNHLHLHLHLGLTAAHLASMNTMTACTSFVYKQQNVALLVMPDCIKPEKSRTRLKKAACV